MRSLLSDLKRVLTPMPLKCFVGAIPKTKSYIRVIKDLGDIKCDDEGNVTDEHDDLCALSADGLDSVSRWIDEVVNALGHIVKPYKRDGDYPGDVVGIARTGVTVKACASTSEDGDRHIKLRTMCGREVQLPPPQQAQLDELNLSFVGTLHVANGGQHLAMKASKSGVGVKWNDAAVIYIIDSFDEDVDEDLPLTARLDTAEERVVDRPLFKLTEYVFLSEPFHLPNSQAHALWKLTQVESF